MLVWERSVQALQLALPFHQGGKQGGQEDPSSHLQPGFSPHRIDDTTRYSEEHFPISTEICWMSSPVSIAARHRQLWVGAWTQLSSIPGSGKTAALTSSPAGNPAKHNRAAAEVLRNQNGKEPKSGLRTPRSSEKQAHLPLLMELSQRERFNLF